MKPKLITAFCALVTSLQFTTAEVILVEDHRSEFFGTGAIWYLDQDNNWVDGTSLDRTPATPFAAFAETLATYNRYGNGTLKYNSVVSPDIFTHDASFQAGFVPCCLPGSAASVGGNYNVKSLFDITFTVTESTQFTLDIQGFFDRQNTSGASLGTTFASLEKVGTGFLIPPGGYPVSLNGVFEPGTYRLISYFEDFNGGIRSEYFAGDATHKLSLVFVTDTGSTAMGLFFSASLLCLKRRSRD